MKHRLAMNFVVVVAAEIVWEVVVAAWVLEAVAAVVVVSASKIAGLEHRETFRGYLLLVVVTNLPGFGRFQLD